MSDFMAGCLGDVLVFSAWKGDAHNKTFYGRQCLPVSGIGYGALGGDYYMYVAGAERAFLFNGGDCIRICLFV